MKRYKVKLLTKQGVVELIIAEIVDMPKFEKAVVEQYGDFIMISSEQI